MGGGVSLQVEIDRRRMENWNRGKSQSMDPWLSMSSPLRPIGPPKEEDNNLIVSELINSNTNQWSCHSVIHYIPGYERDLKELPVGSSRREDAMVWLHNKNGEYTSRSGYGVLTAREVEEVRE